MTRRIERLDSTITQELSRLIMRELEFDGVLLTLTKTETSDDLTHAKVYCSVLPSEKSSGIIKVLNKKADHLRYLLLKKMVIRAVPHLKFEIDEGYENANKVEEILAEEEKKGLLSE